MTQHLNDFDMITNELSFVEIEFDGKIRALILVTSFPNMGKALRMAVSNSTNKMKLSCMTLFSLRKYVEKTVGVF